MTVHDNHRPGEFHPAVVESSEPIPTGSLSQATGCCLSELDVVRSSLPPEGQSDYQEPDESSHPDHKFDRSDVKLERRGVTSHVPRQGLLFAKELIFHRSVVAKLNQSDRSDLSELTNGCHTQKSVRQCIGCRRHSVFWNRCDLKWCPICSQRLAYERRKAVEWWTRQLSQPKHVVLTVRNTETITKDHVKKLKSAFGRLRRRAFARNWAGGFYSLEVTNESRGWHLHLHALIDARWIDSGALAREWADCVGQLFAIVKVKDCRDTSYLQEVTKYAVKGSDLASWSGSDIASFIDAFQGVRTFGVFGSLYGKRTEWSDFIKQLQANRVRCVCGCDNWRILTDQEFEWEVASSDPVTESIPPPQQTGFHPELPLNLATFPR